MSVETQSAVPSFIGKYRLLAELGAGGMANVFLVVAQGPSGFNKLLVLKTLRPNLAEDPEIVQMFLDEAKLAGRLSHPNVVQTYEVGEESGRFVLVMEYLDGQSLSTVLNESRKCQFDFSIAMQVRVIINSLQGLNYAHELKDFDGTPFNIVHRDATPQNLFVTYDGQIKVLDFGIAKAVTSSAETRSGIFKGKLAYMAPEQFLGEKIDRRVDIYAVGSILWEICTGKRLWKSTPDAQLLHRVLSGDIPKPSSINPNCPPGLERICEKAMSLNREDRYPDASALQEALENFLVETNSCVSAREVGTAVATLFKDRRAQVQNLIDSQLRKLASEDTSSFQAIRIPVSGSRSGTGSWSQDDSSKHSFEGSSPERETSNQSLSGPHSLPSIDTESSWRASQNALAGSIRTSMRPHSKSKSLYVGIGVATAAIVGAVFFFLSRSHAQPPPTGVAQPQSAEVAAAPEPKVSSTTPAAMVPGDISVELRATPSHAKLYFDEALLPTNPYVKRVPRDTSTHKIRIEAAGFTAQVIEISSDKDSALNIPLEPLPSSNKATHSRPTNDSSQATSTSHPSPSQPPTTTPETPAKKPGRGIDKSNPFE